MHTVLTVDRPAMLKKRIHNWDLDRNNKEPDMLYALRVAFERHDRGKDTNFVIRGRIVTFADVKRYFRRKGCRDLRSLLGEVTPANPSANVQCHTPHPGG